MKNYLTIYLLLFFVAATFALPAKRGQWKLLTLSDSSQVKAELRGDEHGHWWRAEDGTCYVADTITGTYVVKTVSNGAKRRLQPRYKLNKEAGNDQSSASSLFQGNRKGLIILAEFPNCKFTLASQSTYDSIANVRGYKENGFNGSVRDYFIEQSGEKFDLSFDVAGPVMMSHVYSYYGKNDEANADEMIREACLGVDSLINFADYDWDGDGEAEEVFVVYAGHGQADYHSDNDSFIWPHMYWLEYTDAGKLTLDNIAINVYACAPELNGSGNLDGIGSFCHEFSHCMGLPDMYDTSDDATNFGMGSWDLMDYGSYNGDGYTPAGYSGYEKMVCGWVDPVELTDETSVTDMQPLSSMGQTYIVYNKGNNNEYYILANRQQQGFDAELPGHGLLIEHIDYDADVWDNNAPNTTSDKSVNDHQRITIFHADNTDGFYDQATDAYPYNGNDSLTNSSTPAATVYNANSDGSYFMNYAIRNIVQNDDGSMSFTFAKDSTVTDNQSADSVIFKETFDQCNGTGGNDGKFNGRVAIGALFPDNDGWEMYYNYNRTFLYSANKCAKIGTSEYLESGSVLSPSFTLRGDTATLTFKAACWNATKDKPLLTVAVVGGNASLVEDGDNMTLPKGEWKDFTLHIVGSGSVRLLFDHAYRFFLDEVVVTGKTSSGSTDIPDRGDDPDPSTGISSPVLPLDKSSQHIYTVTGQYVGTNLDVLPHGIYIVDGKKVIR